MHSQKEKRFHGRRCNNVRRRRLLQGGRHKVRSRRGGVCLIDIHPSLHPFLHEIETRKWRRWGEGEEVGKVGLGGWKVGVGRRG
jgi:hypothetical protein